MCILVETSEMPKHKAAGQGLAVRQVTGQIPTKLHMSNCRALPETSKPSELVSEPGLGAGTGQDRGRWQPCCAFTPTLTTRPD